MKRVNTLFAGFVSLCFLPLVAQPAQAIQSYNDTLDDAPLTTASVGHVASSLKKSSYYNIDVTGTAGPFIEAEACKFSTHYYLQMNKKGQVLQRTRLGECSQDTHAAAKKKDESGVADQHAAALDGRRQKKAKVIPVRRSTRQSVEIHPTRRKRKKGLSRVQMLRKHGYKHIYVPRKRGQGVMACKNGKEYAFDVMMDNITDWRQMRSRRMAFGKCFGYGKQILSSKQLVRIMRRHGDKKIKVVRGNLPMFEAYSCLNGKRQHVKINRWGNNNTRIIGKCR